MLRRYAFITLALILFLLTFFCLYGMLHAREPGTGIGWFIGYGVAVINFGAFGVLCLIRGIKGK